MSGGSPDDKEIKEKGSERASGSVERSSLHLPVSFVQSSQFSSLFSSASNSAPTTTSPISSANHDATIIKHSLWTYVTKSFPPHMQKQAYQDMCSRYEKIASGHLSAILSPNLTNGSVSDSLLSPSLPPPSPYNYSVYSPLSLSPFNDNPRPTAVNGTGTGTASVNDNLPSSHFVPPFDPTRMPPPVGQHFVFPDRPPPPPVTTSATSTISAVNELLASHYCLSNFTSSPSFPLMAPPPARRNGTIPPGLNSKAVISTYSIHSVRPPFRKDSTTTLNNQKTRMSSSSSCLTPPISSSSAASAMESLSLMSLSSPPIHPTPSAFIPDAALPIFSRKVFVGGLPWDVQKDYVKMMFEKFGKVEVDWPRETARTMEMKKGFDPQVNGYVFLVYENEQSVRSLVASCTKYNDEYFMPVFSQSCYKKFAQVRPWLVASTNYMPDPKAELDVRKTIFIGGLPRITTAEYLAKTFESMYGKVLFCGVDVDPDLKYPKGAARVCFATNESYLRALNARYVIIPGIESSKREVQIKPYLMDEEPCDECLGTNCYKRMAPFYCADCKQFYCQNCWNDFHLGEGNETRSGHKHLMRVGDQSNNLISTDDRNIRQAEYLVEQLMPKPYQYSPASLDLSVFHF